MAHEVSCLVTLKSRLEAMMSRLGLEAMMSRLGRFGPRSSSAGGMLPRKIFEKSHPVMAVLVLFEQFSDNFV